MVLQCKDLKKSRSRREKCWAGLAVSQSLVFTIHHPSIGTHIITYMYIGLTAKFNFMCLIATVSKCLASFLHLIHLKLKHFLIYTQNRIEIEFRFEKAYCFYRLNKTQEALDILNAIAEPTQPEKELKAQVVRLLIYLFEQFFVGQE